MPQEEDFRVVIWRKEKPSQDDSASNSASNSASRGQVSDSVIRLLLVLSGEMSMREIMDKLNFTSRPMFQNNYLTPALDFGFVEKTQPKSPKSPTQKYRLTAAGREILKDYLSEQ